MHTKIILCAFFKERKPFPLGVYLNTKIEHMTFLSYALGMSASHYFYIVISGMV